MGNIVLGVFVGELFVDFVEEDKGSLQFDRAVGQADKEQVVVLADVIDVSV